MQAGDYNAALPLLEQAVNALQGSGSLDENADYNLAFTRFTLGDCTDVLSLLDESRQIQGHRKEIDHLQRREKLPERPMSFGDSRSRKR